MACMILEMAADMLKEQSTLSISLLLLHGDCEAQVNPNGVKKN